ncbi:MAG TPA: hypothetical protein VK420_18850, partial [Longimicrobium sp.]|nr:hypothetical protein [Longimicrobium sp.]
MLLLSAAPAFANAPPPFEAPKAGAAISSGNPPLDVRLTVTPERVRLGEPFVYELSLKHPKAVRYDVNVPEALGAFERLGLERRREDGADSATTTFRLKLAVFELGKHPLPALTFDVAGPEGDGRYEAPGAEVEALPSIAEGAGDADQLRDVRPPVALEVLSYRKLFVLLGLGALAAVAAVLARKLWALRGRARPLLPLEQRVREALDALERRNLPGLGRVRDFHFDLSELVRAYLGERYGFDALELTSTELLDRLRRHDTPGLPFGELSRFLRESDLVKFAQAPAGVGECEGALAFARQLVEQTTPSPAGATDARP